MPNNMTLTRAYEGKRDLVTSMTYKRATTTVVSRGYTYDALARPVTRTTARQKTTRNDAFTYNSRSELVAATLGTAPYGYGYDNIGNRKTAQELADELTYAANQLNQYASITKGEEAPFVPTYDANGNQTSVKTATGIWTVQYDANNRPVIFTKTEAESTTVVECGYDSMGRRYMKKMTVNGTVTLHHRYIYRGYLQIACCDLKRSAHPVLWLITWDPAEPMATRPLAIQKDGTWYCYGLDITKNMWELFGSSGYIRTAYDYTPYGGVTEEGDVAQPVQWSSEMYDAELALVYYNFRHYNPMDGRWINRDPILKSGTINLYSYVGNNAIIFTDRLGLTIDMKITYDTLSNIWSTYGVYAYTGDANRKEVPHPKEEGNDDFEKKLEKGLCCSKVSKAKKLKISVTTVLPSDWGNPTLINNMMTAFSRAGYNSTIQHEFRRRSVYTKANRAFLAPAEESGKEVTKCGWICRKSEAESEKALSDYLDGVRAEAKRNYLIYRLKSTLASCMEM